MYYSAMEIKEKQGLDQIVSLCKQRGFIYPSSEIYGGFAGVYDYGPLGVELINNLKSLWWKKMVSKRRDITGLDSGIFTHPKVWEASGHVGGFSDPLVECKKCGVRSRADHLLEEAGAVADEKMGEEEINKLFDEYRETISCPSCREKDFTTVKLFNLLVKSNLGDFSNDNSDPVYLRGETCQGIYINYLNVLNSTRNKLPFGIAQIGKVFRNEIAPRQFIFRTREFEQMEMQYFVSPENEMEEYNKLKDYRWDFLLEIGLSKKNLRWHQHENLVFYAKEAFDIEYKYPIGWKELEGIHARGNYDLSQHTKYSGQDLTYFDEKTGERFTPHIIESSVGVGRLALATICEAHDEEVVNGEKRIVLRFKKSVAPIKIAILPLSKKAELTVPAVELFDILSEEWRCEYDETQSIGKRYRRQDEIGTPFCVTFDFDSLDDNAVTIRERDSMKQERVQIKDLKKYFQQQFNDC